jgi:predicted NBD/HSP70 family sugar kinase
MMTSMTALRTSAQTALLRAVHDQPGGTRAALAHDLGIPSGFAAETVARLVAMQLLAEQPAPPTGSRGRPTTSLQPHPDGPLVAVAAIAQETWDVAAVQLGGTQIASGSGTHQRDPDRVLAAVAAQLNGLSGRFGTRIRAAAVSGPGTVVGSRLVHAPNLGWHDVDLSVLWPRHDQDVPLITGNDATFAAIAESRHGAGSGAGTMVYLHIEAGIGGAIVEGDRVVLGATGTAGEFGHMPFGDPGQRCRCGAMGCWNTSVDGYALARAQHESPPADEVSYIRRMLAAARAREPAATRAVQAAARSLGRGAAGLVNALDPHLITVGGLGTEFLDVAGGHVLAAYQDGLMAFRSLPAPPLIPARLSGDGPLLGAAELCFDRVLTDEGVQSWTAGLTSRAAR